MRAEMREKQAQIEELLRLARPETAGPLKGNVKKVMKLSQQRVKLMQKLNIRSGFVAAMKEFYEYACFARIMGIPCVNHPDIYKQEALKYAKTFGDSHMI